MAKVVGSKKIKRNLKNVSNNFLNDAEKVFEANFETGTTIAKERAPWTDRTGFARTSINNKVIRINKNIIGVLGIGAYYGVFLELSNGGKYRVIRPTLKAIETFIKKDLKQINFKK